MQHHGQPYAQKISNDFNGLHPVDKWEYFLKKDYQPGWHSLQHLLQWNGIKETKGDEKMI
jgi:hypothetical protein